MSELGSSSDISFQILAVHDVHYLSLRRKNPPFGLLLGANCAQRSGVSCVSLAHPFCPKLGCKWEVPPYIQNQPSVHMVLDVSSHHPPGAPLPPTSRPIAWLWRYKNRHFCVRFFVLHGVSTKNSPFTTEEESSEEESDRKGIM